jgi:hypothetical protein
LRGLGGAGHRGAKLVDCGFSVAVRPSFEGRFEVQSGGQRGIVRGGPCGSGNRCRGCVIACLPIEIGQQSGNRDIGRMARDQDAELASRRGCVARSKLPERRKESKRARDVRIGLEGSELAKGSACAFGLGKDRMARVVSRSRVMDERKSFEHAREPRTAWRRPHLA